MGIRQRRDEPCHAMVCRRRWPRRPRQELDPRPRPPSAPRDRPGRDRPPIAISDRRVSRRQADRSVSTWRSARRRPCLTLIPGDPSMSTSVRPSGAAETAHSCLIKNRSLYVRYLRWRLSRPEDAKDAYQDFCLKVLRQRDARDDGAQAEAWLQRVLHATLIDHYRRRASRQRGEEAYTREPWEDRNDPRRMPFRCAAACAWRFSDSRPSIPNSSAASIWRRPPVPGCRRAGCDRQPSRCPAAQGAARLEGTDRRSLPDLWRRAFCGVRLLSAQPAVARRDGQRRAKVERMAAVRAVRSTRPGWRSASCRALPRCSASGASTRSAG